MYDLLIKNGLVVDGSGDVPFLADVAVVDIILIRCYINIFKLYEWADTLNCQLNHGLSVVCQG